MRNAILIAVGVLILIAPPAVASIVIHDGTPGIVAYQEDEGIALDSNGHVWSTHYTQGWLRMPEFDPPVPVEQILFWGYHYFVTIYHEAWTADGGWHSLGTWPDLPAAVGEFDPIEAPSISPNPSAGDCRIQFELEAAASVSVGIFDATGRAVRELHSGDLPVGSYSLRWDGRGDDGRDLPAGVFFSHVTTPQGTTTGRIVLTR